MYIISVLIEHPVQSLDMTFDYLSDYVIGLHHRVSIMFHHQKIIGYVMDVQYTNKTREELELENGFHYQMILDVLDDMPVLNEELRSLSITLSKLSLATRMACIQAMLPSQLKPKKGKHTGIQYERIVIGNLGFALKTTKQQEAYQYILDHPSSLIKNIPYSKALLDNMVKQGAIEYHQIEKYRIPQNTAFIKKVHTLSKEQQYIVEDISKKDTYGVNLLHGVTGAGKSEVYVQIAKNIVKKGKTVIVLVPEIALTPMMIALFKSHFDQNVAILHSKLSSGERYDEYRRIQNKEVSIVVGARSAIFAPLENIGLIVMDEEHDSSYKQTTTPRYHCLEIAKIRAKTHQCPILLASATPSLESYYRALEGFYDLYTLENRINQQPLPPIEFVSMEKEMRDGNYSLLSRKLVSQLQACIDSGNQAILLLNQRGYANHIRCLDCNTVVKCPHCDISLTYHHDTKQLHCHYCDYRQPYTNTCPTCQSSNMKLVGTGTQKMEEILAQELENATIIRYDYDSTRNKQGHQKLLDRFKNKEANILLGTQMIAKGLDFPDVTLVGVINADISLHIPDFRSNERTFQLLSQVAGRTGRADKPGTVTIQTYNEKHPVLVNVKNHNYIRFYQEEMKYRKLAMYPPYRYLLSVLIEGKQEEQVELYGQYIKKYLVKELPNQVILGPTSGTISKINNYYRRRILIKYRSLKEIYEVIRTMHRYYNKKETKIRVICDFDPYNQL